METVTIPREEFKKMKKEASVTEDLLTKLVRGLEDIRTDKIRIVNKC